MQKFLSTFDICICEFRYYKTLNLYWDERAVNTAISSCGEIEALPVTIHNAEASDLTLFCAFLDAFAVFLSCTSLLQHRIKAFQQNQYWAARGWLVIGN